MAMDEGNPSSATSPADDDGARLLRDRTSTAEVISIQLRAFRREVGRAFARGLDHGITEANEFARDLARAHLSELREPDDYTCFSDDVEGACGEALRMVRRLTTDLHDATYEALAPATDRDTSDLRSAIEELHRAVAQDIAEDDLASLTTWNRHGAELATRLADAYDRSIGAQTPDYLASAHHLARGVAVALMLAEALFRARLRDLSDVDVCGLDLTEADFLGATLDGVRWSASTSWPSDMADWVRDRSVETDIPGTHVVRGGTRR
jgi:uncharacterized protein YjbI with pentapeptide repeats